MGIWVNLDSEHQEIEKSDFNHVRTYELYFVFEADIDFTKHQNQIEMKLSSILEKNKVLHNGSIISHFLSIDDFSLREARQFTFLNFDYLSTD